MEYKVISYDVWGNEEDGYQVNDAYTTNLIVEIEETDNDKAIVQKLVDAGYCTPKALDCLTLDPNIDHSHTIYLIETNDHKPFCELRPITE